MLGYVSSFPEGSGFFSTPSFRQRFSGSSDSMDSVRDTRGCQRWDGVKMGWVKWPQGGGGVFEKG